MVGFIKESGGGDFTPTPEGQHIMVCARVIDLGTQPGSGQFPDPKHKVRIFWELPEERVTYKDADGNEQTGPVLHSEQYTASFHEKSNLRKHLESWRGKPFSKEDFSGPPNGFHLNKLIGIPALGQIVHDHKDGKTYANLNSIMKPRQTDFDRFLGKIEGTRIFFDLDDFSQDEFDKLSDRVKETVKRSPEYQALFNQQQSYPSPQNSEDPSGGLRDEQSFEDTEIPF